MTDVKRLLTVQIIKTIRVDGRVRYPGERMDLEANRGHKLCQIGYAVKVNPDEPYSYPASDSKHKFQPVSFDEPEPVIAETPVPVLPIPEPEPVVIQGVPSFKDLGLTGFQIGSLKKEGYNVLSDLKGVTREMLMLIDKISDKAADKLVRAYEMHIAGIAPEPEIRGNWE